MGEKPSLDTAAEEECEYRYAAQGQENKEETTILLWHQRTQHTPVELEVIDAMLDHMEDEINLRSYTQLRCIEKFANQVSCDTTTVSETLILIKQQVALVSADKDQIKKVASTISKREKLI